MSAATALPKLEPASKQPLARVVFDDAVQYPGKPVRNDKIMLWSDAHKVASLGQDRPECHPYLSDDGRFVILVKPSTGERTEVPIARAVQFERRP